MKGADMFELGPPILPRPFNIYYHNDDQKLYYWVPDEDGRFEKLFGTWQEVRWKNGYWEYQDPKGRYVRFVDG